MTDKNSVLVTGRLVKAKTPPYAVSKTKKPCAVCL